MALLLAALSSIACAAALYPDVQFYDSGELATASVYLGIGHGPGQPLYCMLSHAFLWIPFGSLAFRLCLFSAACTVLSVLLLQRILFDSVARSRGERLLVTLALACFPLHAFVHEQAGRIELYSLQMLLACVALYGCSRLRESALEGYLISLAAVCLSAGVHPLLGAALAPLLVPAAVTAFGRQGRTRVILLTAGVVVPSACLLLYSVLRSKATGAWLSVDGLDEWWRYVTGSMYARSFSAVRIRAFDHFSVIARATAVPLVAAALGLWASRGLPGRMWMPLAVLAAGLLPSILQRHFIPQNLDYHGYLLPSLSAAVLLGTTGLVALHRRVAHRPVLAALVLACSPALTFASWPAGLHGHIRDERAADLAYRLTDAVPEGPAIVDLALDSTLFPVSYLRDVAGIRPDVLIAHPIRFGNDTMRRRARLAGYAVPDAEPFSPSFRRMLARQNPGARLLLVSPDAAGEYLESAPSHFRVIDFLYEPSTGHGPGCASLLEDLRRPAYRPLPAEAIEELPVTAFAFRQMSTDMRIGRFACAGRTAAVLGRLVGVDLGQLEDLPDAPGRPLLFFPGLPSSGRLFLYERAAFLLRAADLAFATGHAELGTGLCLEAYGLGRDEAALLARLWAEELGMPEIERAFGHLVGEGR